MRGLFSLFLIVAFSVPSLAAVLEADTRTTVSEEPQTLAICARSGAIIALIDQKKSSSMLMAINDGRSKRSEYEFFEAVPSDDEGVLKLLGTVTSALTGTPSVEIQKSGAGSASDIVFDLYYEKDGEVLKRTTFTRAECEFNLEN